MYTVRGYLPASEDIKDNLMGVDRVQEELQQLNQLKQVCNTFVAVFVTQLSNSRAGNNI